MMITVEVFKRAERATADTVGKRHDYMIFLKTPLNISMNSQTPLKNVGVSCTISSIVKIILSECAGEGMFV
jgi:hypothetical protein